ncbi:MAG TPA: cytochrome c oxidase subunit 3 [Rhizomicrobium sp.]|nr:cytochrome c oxidase subunit 3 [Rhizomicrobium sp.]
MRTRVALNVSPLPTNAFGSRALTWWGTIAFMSLEGMGFALAIGAYLYLRTRAAQWPINSPPPDLLPGTGVTIILLLSLIPNYFAEKWARSMNLKKVQWSLVLMSVVGVSPLIVRVFEFGALHARWDSDAYGSLVWFLLGLHTTHLLTDVGDTIVLAVLMFTRHGNNPRRFGDASDNAFYWDFVVLSWLPIYFVIYWIPRL